MVTSKETNMKHPYLNAYIRGINIPRGRWEIRESLALKEKFATDAYVVDGVPYWKSNNRIPPQDILEFWAYCNLPIDLGKATAEREAETSAFLTKYRDRMANHVPSGEELFEMRAAFGTGVTIVNAITGTAIKL
jgi:hypothetical protein